ncbi:phosphoribosylformylglycinamidine synthase I [Chloroherpeton thalassium ATCC 35110]|uniref:Phosphoribosylformylglycinamidine synthase subunit PurQ n=1 Tax=Chloroherpeton thalassium (strain ATCC 35110 / GB-78) TaxID=517418 RepID=B3QTD5_CHLT3|nr:phosphoribosylformylglycinamidine synthase subunit PurQ [Chloroherpeton thalassium]ACF12681.1 phosphoribosylformylglycinamidine synthase I [Chloroherpeton thalassium ATCC 35110]
MAKTKFGIVVFPGSNCDHDTEYVCNAFPNAEAKLIWHQESDLQGADVIVLPGGFSYGDYLRAGAIAKFSPVMQEVIRFAGEGRPVIGICNGFQVLLESGLLEGAMMHNKSRRFICKFVYLKVANNQTLFTSKYEKDAVVRIPIAHGEGNFFASEATLSRLQENEQIVFQYCDKAGQLSEAANPNGSCLNIAGIVNEKRNVLGMMPHPERASDAMLGSTDGSKVFESILNNFVEAV